MSAQKRGLLDTLEAIAASENLMEDDKNLSKNYQELTVMQDKCSSTIESQELKEYLTYLKKNTIKKAPEPSTDLYSYVEAENKGESKPTLLDAYLEKKARMQEYQEQAAALEAEEKEEATQEKIPSHELEMMPSYKEMRQDQDLSERKLKIEQIRVKPDEGEAPAKKKKEVKNKEPHELPGFLRSPLWFAATLALLIVCIIIIVF